MNVNWLLEYAVEKAHNYPQHKDEIKEICELCMSEIEEGGSVSGEIESALQSIDEVIGEDK